MKIRNFLEYSNSISNDSLLIEPFLQPIHEVINTKYDSYSDSYNFIREFHNKTQINQGLNSYIYQDLFGVHQD
jgi:hypothetical protein